MKTIDLNCDVGEGLNNEEKLFPFISSCNIACGKHAGDMKTIERLIELAKGTNTNIGAHPGFDDPENFGRIEMHLKPADLRDLMAEQVELMLQTCIRFGAEMTHVKPHGALYNLAAKSEETSEVIVRTLMDLCPNTRLFGLASSATERIAKGKISFVPEGFADRRYTDGGQLMSRKENGLITNTSEILDQLQCILMDQEVKTPSGKMSLNIQTLCLHGDTPGAEELIPKIREAVESMGLQVQAP